MCSPDFGIVEVKGPEAAVMKSCHVTWDLNLVFGHIMEK